MSTPADLTRLMNNARIHLPGATDDALKLELFNVLTEFFQVSKAWQEDVRVTARVGETEYEVLPSDPGTIDSLISVCDENEFSVAATMPTVGTIVLRDEPSVAQVLTVKVALTVVDPVSTDNYPLFPSWLLAKYGKYILEGLLAHMMTQPAKPYSSEKMGIFRMRKFRAGIAQARSEARHQHLYGGQTWRFPQAWSAQ